MRRHVLSIAAVLLLVSSARAQDSDISGLEAEFTSLDSTIQKMDIERRELRDRVRSNSDEIKKIKSETDLGFLQRQKLESLLKDSHSLGQKIEKIDHDVTSLEHTRIVTGEKLIRGYNALINNKLTQSKKQLETTRQKNLSDIAELRQKIQLVRAQIETPQPEEIEIVALQIQPDDSPRQIEQKGDLLKDQEDKFRHRGDRISQQVRELESELKLRTRVNELVTDISLFDPQDEILNDFSNSNDQSSPLTEGADIGVRARPPSESFVLGQKNFDVTGLSTQQLEEAIQLLKVEKLKNETKADSLATLAQKFYRASEESKKQ